MTAKTPDSPQESRPPTAASSTPSVPAQPTPPAPPAAATTTSAAASASAAPAATSRPATKPPAKPPTKAAGTSKSGSGGAAFVVAVFAVLVAIGSTVVSVYALDVAREAKSRTADSAATRPTPTAPAASVRASSAPATSSPATTTPRAQFVPESLRADLRIPPADGCASVFVDIDTMQVGVDNGHEFYLSSCLGAPSLRIDKTSGAVPTQENPTPEVCVAQLAGSTPTTELVLQIRIGLTFCLLTNKEEAVRQGIPQRVGIIEVRDMGVDKSVTVTVSTYRVPS